MIRHILDKKIVNTLVIPLRSPKKLQTEDGLVYPWEHAQRFAVALDTFYPLIDKNQPEDLTEFFF